MPIQNTEPQRRRAISLIASPIPSAAERSAALADQAKDLAREALVEVMGRIADLEKDARSLSTLEPLPAGIREELRQLSDNLNDRKQRVAAIWGRR